MRLIPRGSDCLGSFPSSFDGRCFTREGTKLVIRRSVLHALAIAEESGNVDVAATELRRLDPLLRILARRRLSSLLREAERLSFVRETRHELRLAFLLGAVGSPASNFDDVEGLQREFEEQRASLKKAGSKRWFTPVVVATMAACLVATFVYRRLQVPFTPLDTPTGALLGPQLTSFVVDVNRKERRANAASRATPSAAAASAFGPPLVTSWNTLLERTTKLTTAPADHYVDAWNQASAATTHVDSELATRGLPFFVDLETLDGSADERRVLLLSFYVEREAATA